MTRAPWWLIALLLITGGSAQILFLRLIEAGHYTGWTATAFSAAILLGAASVALAVIRLWGEP